MQGSKIRKWTDEEVAFLRKHKGKLTSSEIAKELNRTSASVNSAMQRYGISDKSRRWTAEEDALIREMLEEGYNSREIAEKLGVYTSLVSVRINFLGIKRPTYKNSPNKKRNRYSETAIYDLIRGDVTLATGNVYEIAEQCGTSVSTIMHYGSNSYKKRTNNGRAQQLIFLYDEGDDDE